MTTLGQLSKSGVVEFSDGYRTKGSEQSESGFRILRAGDLHSGRAHFDGPDFVDGGFAGAIGAKTVRRGDVALTTKGTVGRVALVGDVPTPAVYSPQICFFRIAQPQALQPRFLLYWFQSREFQQQASYLMAATDMAPYLSLRDIGEMTITLPDLGTQRSIAEVLGSLDDKIAANERVVETTTALAVALLTESSNRLPLTTLAELAALRKVQVQPAQWDTVAHFSLPAFDEGQRPAVERTADIKSTKFLLERPCVLLSKLNPRIPRVWDVSALPTLPALASTEFLVLEPNGIPSTVLWATLRLGSSLEEMVSLARGTSGSHQRVAPNEAMELTVPDVRQLPKSDIQLLTALGHQRHAAIAQQARLAATRDALLPGLMSGELSVREVTEPLAEDPQSGSADTSGQEHRL